MNAATKKYYENRGKVLVKNLKSRYFDAYYCDNKEQALEKALELIPADAVIGWGGATSAQQIGLMETLNAKGYYTLDRDKVSDMPEKLQISKQCLLADVFLTGANAISLDGQMVNIDGTGNRVAAIVYGPDMVLVIAGMNKVADTLEEAMDRARHLAAPMNNQRFDNQNPCKFTGSCADCKCETCICNQILITRHCRPAGRIKFILVGEELGY